MGKHPDRPHAKAEAAGFDMSKILKEPPAVQIHHVAEETTKSVLVRAKALGILAFDSRAEAIEAAFDAGVECKRGVVTHLVYFEVVSRGRFDRKNVHTFVLHYDSKWHWDLSSPDTV